MIPSSSRDRDLEQMDRGSLRAAVSKCRDRIEHLELMVLKLRRDHYGPSSERAPVSDEQLTLSLIPEERVSDPADQPSQHASVQPQPSSVRKSRALPAHLRREVHTHLPDGKHCPDCGGRCGIWAKMSRRCSSTYQPVSSLFVTCVPSSAVLVAARWCRLRRRPGRSTAVFLAPACSPT